MHILSVNIHTEITIWANFGHSTVGTSLNLAIQLVGNHHEKVSVLDLVLFLT